MGGEGWGRRLALLLVAATYGLPLVYMVATSLKTRQDVFESPASLIFAPTLAAYAELWTPALARAALNSALIALATTALVLALATPAAYWLARGRGWAISLGLGSLILLQMVPQANTVIPLFQVMGRWGLLRLQAFARISLPLARNGLVTVATLVWIIVWGEFLYAITFLSGADTMPLSGLLGGQMTQFGIEWQRLMAMAVLVALPVLVVFVASERRLAEGLVLGSGK